MIKDPQASQASFTNGMIPSSRFIKSCFVPEKFTRINRKLTQVAIAWALRRRFFRGLQISFPDSKVVRRYGKKNQLTAVVSRSYHRCRLHKNYSSKSTSKILIHSSWVQCSRFSKRMLQHRRPNWNGNITDALR